MSGFLGQARVRSLRPSFPRPRLTVVQKVAPRAPRVPFIALVLTLLVGGLVGLLVLNTTLQKGAYTLTSLRETSSDLTIQRQQLELQVAQLREPQRIASEAQRLGMVAGDTPAFLSLAQDRVIGEPAAGRRANRVDVGVAPRGVGGHAARGGAKVELLLAGEANTGTTGPVRVAAVKPPGPGGGGARGGAGDPGATR